MPSTLTLYKFIAEFVDFEGEIATSIAWYPADSANDTVADIQTALDTWATAIAALSNANLRNYGFQLDTINGLGLPTVPANTMYPNIEDKLFLEFISDVDGTAFKQNIPAPKNTDFGTDQETVSWVAAAVSTYTTLIQASHRTSAGGASPVKIKGYLRRAKTRRRVRQGIPSEMGG